MNEEDIKILERMLEIEKECLHYDVSKDEIKAIENLINRNKELEYKYDKALSDLVQEEHKNKEIEEEIIILKGQNRYQYDMGWKSCEIESIPKFKVKEKIEELDKEEKRELKGTKGQDRYYIKQKYMYKRKVLEELLQEGE